MKEKLKISARSVGRKGRNLREVLSNSLVQFDCEVGGHEFAAGATIDKTHEQESITSLKKNLDLEVVKI